MFPRSPPCFPSKHAGKPEEERRCFFPHLILISYLKTILEICISGFFKLCVFWAPLDLKLLSTFVGFRLDPPTEP